MDTEIIVNENMIYLFQTIAIVFTKANELGKWLYSYPFIGLLTDQTLYQYKQLKCYYLGMSCEPNYDCYFLSASLNKDFSAISVGLYQTYLSRENWIPVYEYVYYVGLLSEVKLTVQKIQQYYFFRETTEHTARSLTLYDVHESAVRFLVISYSHPDMDETITIELPAAYYLVNNVLFSATFIRWWLEYNMTPDDYVFDGRYEISLMDTMFQMTTLRAGQSICLHAMSYSVLPFEQKEEEEEEEEEGKPDYQFETIEKTDVTPITETKCRWFFW